MPSPFPGMDPYLEHPDFWPEVHNRLIVAIADFLVPQVRPKYRVAIEKRIYEITPNNGDNSLLIGIPDIAINRQSTELEPSQPQIAVASPNVKPIMVTLPMPEQIKQSYLEIRDLATGQVITAIELLSPVNKRTGAGRQAYLKKRQNILGSLTHLVEIDLLRGWSPMPMQNQQQSDYRLLVSREAHRPKAELYAFNLRTPIPEISLPLRAEDTEPVVALQTLLNQVYDHSGYDYVLDYNRPTNPPLSEEDSNWASELLHHQGFLN